MMLRMMLFLAFSLLSACTSVRRPDVDLCIVNAPAQHLKCYNLLRDYTADGQLKPDAVPSYRRFGEREDLNKYLCVDPNGLAKLKAYIRELREAYENQCYH